MTIFAGAFSLAAGGNLANHLADDLKGLLSRNERDEASAITGPGFAFAFLDLGLLPGASFIAESGSAYTCLAGDPLLTSRQGNSRFDDLRSLHSAWAVGSDPPLVRARGEFCAAHMDVARGRLVLVTDKLGLRPLYFTSSGGAIYFASALRILEDLPALQRQIDIRGLLETAAISFPLGSRTPYRAIERLNAGEVVSANRGHGVRRNSYWKWSDLPEKRLSAGELSRALYESFCDAVRWRMGTARRVLAFLSGGLDSRCTAAALRAEGAHVHTINLAPKGTLDLELGRFAASQLQTEHFEFDGAASGFFERTRRAHGAWLDLMQSATLPDQPRVAWTGNGGSVAMGHVYLTERVVRLMADGQVANAVDTFVAEQRLTVSLKSFRGEFRQLAGGIARQGVADELGRVSTFEEGRRFHLFLMLNDQKRHLDAYFEEIDRIRLELVNPFYDSEFLKLVLSSPVAPFLRHCLYNVWLKEFPFEIASVPWQAYRNHEPCPLPLPAGLRHQTADGWYSAEQERRLSLQLMNDASAALRNPRFPDWLLRRKVVLAAKWLTQSGVRDYSHILRIASVCSRFCSKANA